MKRLLTNLYYISLAVEKMTNKKLSSEDFLGGLFFGAVIVLVTLIMFIFIYIVTHVAL